MKSLSNIVIVLFLMVVTLQAGNITGKVKAKGVRHSGNAVVHIEKIDGKKFEAPKEKFLMDQKNIEFIPHILPIVKGSTVEFLNSDNVLHNVFTPDGCADKFNLGTWPKGQKREYTFKEAGCLSVMLCNVHPEMEAYVLVLETPYFAVSAKDGKYEIKDVPAGTYTLTVWHEKLKGKSVEITVPAKGDVSQNFEIRK